MPVKPHKGPASEGTIHSIIVKTIAAERPDIKIQLFPEATTYKTPGKNIAHFLNWLNKSKRIIKNRINLALKGSFSGFDFESVCICLCEEWFRRLDGWPDLQVTWKWAVWQESVFKCLFWRSNRNKQLVNRPIISRYGTSFVFYVLILNYCILPPNS